METVRVLLVEDDAATRKELVEILSKERCEVLEAADGASAFSIFRQERPGIVVTDLKMPGMNGLDLMKKVHELSHDVPVILTTAFGESDVAIDALRFGALDYLKKPIELHELLTALGRAKEVVFSRKQHRTFPTVLLAEDDTAARTQLAGVLTKEGYHVLEAEDGQTALDRFKTTKVDLVLLDIKMPRLCGLEALHGMRQASDDFEAVILTGYGDEDAAIKALRDGAMSFIRKPIDLEALLVILEKATERVSLTRALKYRSREVELAHEIMAQITENAHVTLRLTNDTAQGTMAYFDQVTQQISDGIAVVDEEMRVVFANRRLQEVFGTSPVRMDDELAGAVCNRCGGSLHPEALRTTMTRLLGGPVGDVEILPGDRGSSVLLTKVRIRTPAKKQVCLLMILRL